jgi:DNA primase
MRLRKRFSLVERENILKLASECLWTNDGKPGLEYLKDARKLSEKTIRLFSLGYLPENIKHQLAGRVILPLFDASGSLVAISSRLVKNSGTDALPVYWHESYEKQFYLYGLNNAKEWMRKWSFVVVTEGQFDVMQLYDKGIKNVVGLCSTNLHEMQRAMINRYCEDIVLVLDKDANLSGQKGTARIKNERYNFEYLDYDLKNFLKDRYFLDNSTTEQYDKYAFRIGLVDFGDIKDQKMDADLYIRKYGIKKMATLVKNALQGMRNKYGM